VAAALAFLMAVQACGDPFEPILIPVPDEPEEATLSDFRMGPVQKPAAFDLISVAEIRTDQFSGWDFLFEIDESGTPVFRPRGDVIDEEAEAGLALSSLSFEGLTEAPEEPYVRDAPVAIQVGDVLAVVSRKDPSFGSVRCRHFAKLEILDIDLPNLAMTFRYLVNPNCEKRRLTPGGE
jgi:hypothetical protein